MRKLIRDGKVGIIIGRLLPWYTNHHKEELIYLPELIELLESKEYYYAQTYGRSNTLFWIKNLLNSLEIFIKYEQPSYYTTVISRLDKTYLEVVWLDINTKFTIIRDSNKLEHLVIINKETTFIT